MAHLEIDIQFDDVSGAGAAPGDYGEWIDHRILDGHQTNAWLSRFVEIIESWDRP